MPDRAGPVAGGVRGDARCVSRVVPDVGCRAASDAAPVIARARALATHRDDHALLPLPVLALLIGVHVKTLRAAARDGRLPVTYDTRTTFRRLRARATPAAARAFRRSYYGRPVKPVDRRAPLTWASVPDDYDEQIRALRRARGLSQAQLATLVGAARKAVVYQWEARNARRRPCSGNDSPRSTGVCRSDRKRALTWAIVPENYDEQIRTLRRARGLSQAQLATLVGAARKAVVYDLLKRPTLTEQDWARCTSSAFRRASRSCRWRPGASRRCRGPTECSP